jgi:PAT family beta-lactamase induction signal transducer AmpG
VPILSPLLGRRRGWLMLTQLWLMAAIVLLAFRNPALSPLPVAIAALMVATASATQDILIDAFRVESLPEEEQAAGMASYVAAYRVGALVSGAGTLFLVSGFEGLGFGRETAWTGGFVAMAVLVLVGVAATLLAVEPAQ